MEHICLLPVYDWKTRKLLFWYVLNIEDRGDPAGKTMSFYSIFPYHSENGRVFFHSSTNTEIGALLYRSGWGMIYQYSIHAEFGIPKGSQTHIHYTSIFGVRNSENGIPQTWKRIILTFFLAGRRRSADMSAKRSFVRLPAVQPCLVLIKIRGQWMNYCIIGLFCTSILERQIGVRLSGTFLPVP